ncbi:hypothetical protein K9M59_01060 [Candidatus Gracilibacteria bacterium]|nr:hypothetical protein [Candidatus Gracilibacteria bacterium]MCF7819160.1 hypothetical protein [Candidatus Gracilibacteria bacterium]
MAEDIPITLIEFLEKWQTLVGAALGAFLAIISSLVVFAIKKRWEEKQERREALRRAEVCFSQSLNHVFNCEMQLEDFVQRVKKLIEEIESIDDENTRSLQIANYPPMIKIHFDETLTTMKFKSYYLHNKVLIIEQIVNWANSMINQFKFDFQKLLERNDMLADRNGARAQRMMHAQNLKGYIGMVELFLNSLKDSNTKSIIQAKVYNLKLREEYSKTLKEYEKIPSCWGKLINKIRGKKIKQSLDDLNRINELLEEEVQEVIRDTENRAKNTPSSM